MWGWIGLVAVTVGIRGLQWLMEDDHFSGAPLRESRNIELSIPRVESGSTLPFYFGTVRIRSPILAWYGGFKATITAAGTARYSGNFLYALGVPCPSVAVTLREFYIGERHVSGAVNVGLFPLTNSGTSTIGDTLFLGGDGNGGGIDGTLEFRGGVSPTQTFNGSRHEFVWINYADDPADPDGSLLPGYRGQTCVALSDWIFGERPKMEEYNFRVTADCSAASVGAYAMVNGVDANPVAVLRALITDPWFGLGYDGALIDDTSFDAAAAVLAAENHGISGVVYDKTQGIRVIGSILTQIEAALFRDRTDGLFKIKLIRDDYDPDTIPVLSESSVDAIDSFQMTSYEDLPNEVLIKYTDMFHPPAATETATAQNTGSIALSNGQIRSVTREYPMVSNQVLASKIASRDLAALSIPLFTAKLLCDQTAYTFTPGQAIKWVWPDLGFNDGVIVRVLSVDLGVLTDEKIIVSVIQDRFGLDYSVFDSPPDIEYPPPTPYNPFPIIEHAVFEEPRQLAIFSMFNQHIPNSSNQRLYHLAVAKRGDSYRALNVVGAIEMSDMGDRTFPGVAQVETAYPYYVEPYDTGTGLRIKNVSPPVGNPGAPQLVTATLAQIMTAGKNLIYVGGEFMAFENVTDLGGGVYRLNNVYRALMDTAPRTHLVDDRVYFLGDENPLGVGRHSGHALWDNETGSSPVVKLLPSGQSMAMPSNRAHTITVDPIRDRWLLPLRVADLKANNAKVITELTEDGVDLTYRARIQGNVMIRGDAVSQTPPTSATFWPMGFKTGYDDVELTTSGSAYNVTTIDDVALGRIGHGAVDVGVESRDNIEVVDTVFPFESWDVPKILVNALRWRNLLLNPRFEQAFGSIWTTVSGTPAIGSTAGSALGNGGSYVYDNATGGYSIRQRRNVQGYDPAGVALGLKCVLSWHSIGDATDSITATVKLLDDALTVLATATTTDVSTTTWTRNEIEVAYVAGVTQIEVLFSVDSAELAASTIRLTNVFARVGQVSAELVANGSFETGTTSWTVVTGGFTTGLTTTKYDQGNYIRGGANTTNELSQDLTVPAGHEAMSTAVVEVAVMRDGSDGDDTGEIIVEAYDGGASLIASETSGSFIPTSDSVWERKLVYLDLPTGSAAATIKVRLRAIRVGDAGDANICFDAVRCRMHKELDYSYQNLDFSEPVPQSLATTVEDLVYGAPDFSKWSTLSAVWHGGSITSTMIGPPVLADSGITIGSRFVGPWDGEKSIYEAYRFSGGTGGPDLAASGSLFANYTGTGSFWAFAWVRIDPRDFDSAAHQIFGRKGASRGWEVTIEADGKVKATIYGAAATVSATSVATIADGRPHLIGIRYRAATRVAVVVDGVIAETTSSGWGRIDTPSDEAAWFRIGRSQAGGNGFKGQVQSLFMGGGAADLSGIPTDADVAMLWTHGTDPNDATTTAAAVGAITVPDPAGGVGVLRLPSGATPIVFDPQTETWGLALSRAVTSLLAGPDFTAWTPQGSGTLATLIEDCEGFLRGCRLTGTSAYKLRSPAITVVAGTDVRVTVFARKTPGSVSINDGFTVRLLEGGSLLYDSDVVVTEEWTRCDVILIGAGIAGTSIQIELTASSTTDLFSTEFSGPLVVHQGTEHPIVLPYDSQATAGGAVTTVSPAPDDAFNYGGQFTLVVRAHEPTTAGTTGTILVVDNGVDDKNKRLVSSSVLEARFTLYNASGTGTQSEKSPASYAAYHTIEARWSRAGLIDGPTLFAGIEVDDSGDYDVVSAFTVDANTGPTAPELGASGASMPNMYVRSLQITYREVLPR